MKFTILVAVYNAEEWLPQCLDSLLSQTEQSIQVICIDDCSTDGSADVVRRFMDRDQRVMLLSLPENSGQAVARNLGLEKAEGELTLMVDSDDWLAPDCLEEMWKSYTMAPDVDCVVCRLVRVWNDGREEEVEIPPTTVLSGTGASEMSINWRLHGVYAVRTELHRKYPYDTTCRLYSDDNTSRIHYLHSRRVVISDGTYYYRQHENSSTQQISRRSFDFVVANDSLRSTLMREGVDSDYSKVLEDYIWRNYIGIWRKWNGNRKSFTPEESREIEAILKQSFKKMRFEHVPIHTLKCPSFLAIRNYYLFAMWQRFLMLCHRLL